MAIARRKERRGKVQKPQGAKSAPWAPSVLKDGVSTKAKDGSIRRLRPSDIPKGSKIIVFYEEKRTKADNGKVKVYNEIFRIEKATNLR